MRTILVGLSPPRWGDEPLGVSGMPGRRLRDLIGVKDYEGRFDRINLLPCGSSRIDVRAVAPILRGRRVVALGRPAAEALGASERWFEWTVSDLGFVVAGCPHPSGRSRWWNDDGNKDSATRFLRGLSLPCVHVEGPDGSGKSTLVRSLAAGYGLVEVPTEDPPGSWAECISRIRARLGAGLACDRSSGLISELVYGPVLRGGTIVDERDLWGMVESISGAVVFVYCRPREMSPTFRRGEDPRHVEGVKSRLALLVERYDEVMARVSRTARVVRYDRDLMSLGEVVSCVGS